MAKVAAELHASPGRHRRPRRDPPGTVRTFRLRPVLHGLVGFGGVAMGAFFLGFPVVGLFTPGFWKGSSGWETVGTLLLGCGMGLVSVWLGIRQFRNGAQVSGQELRIRNELRTYRVGAGDIRAITLQPKSGPNNTYWVARVELARGQSIWIDNFDCGPVGKPPKPKRAAAVAEVQALLGVRAGDTWQPEDQLLPGAEDAESRRLLPGVMTGDKDPDYPLRVMIGQGRRGPAAAVSEHRLDETQARINHIEAIIRKFLGGVNAVLWLFLIIAIPDPSAGETDENLPAWLWCGIGIAGVMLALSVLAFRANMPRRMAVIMASNRK